MKLIMKSTLAVILGLSGAALIGCDETVSKTETSTERSDGSKREESKEVTRESDGTIKTEEKKEVTPATNRSGNP